MNTAAPDRILVVDDSPDTLEILERQLSARGYQVLKASSVAEGLRVLEQTSVDLVITDLKMPGVSGLELVRHVRENLRDTQVMMITGYPSIPSAVEAVRTGAEDYLPKPFTEDELESAVRRSFDLLRARRAVEGRPREALPGRHGLLGDSEPMRRVFSAIDRAAASDQPVLITGEIGTGKVLVARAIHEASPRARAPFLVLRCEAAPAGRAEAELFGDGEHPGLFRLAASGTLLLEHVTALPAAAQQRIARHLDPANRGAAGPHVVATCQRDVHSLSHAGAFDEALALRLGALTIAVPPLRDRRDDVLLLAHRFAEHAAALAGREPPRLSDRALQLLVGYSWPGNACELRELIEVLVSRGRDVIDAPDLPPMLRGAAAGERRLRQPLAEVEAEHIRDVLASLDGNRTRAAEILGIDRKTLREKLKRGT